MALEPETEARLARAVRWSGAFTLLLLPAAALMTAFYAPLLPGLDAVTGAAGWTSPLGQKIFYIHLATAFGAYASLTALVFASLRYLSKERDGWDAFTVGCAETGVLLSGLTLFTGSIWAHLEWGVWWNNREEKLVLTLVLFLVYVGYLVLRRQIDEPRRRARIAAVYAVLGFATVPLSYAAQRIWDGIHPTVFAPQRPEQGIVTPGIEETVLVNIVAFLALTAFLLSVRFRLELRRRAGGAAA